MANGRMEWSNFKGKLTLLMTAVQMFFFVHDPSNIRRALNHRVTAAETKIEDNQKDNKSVPLTLFHIMAGMIHRTGFVTI